MQFGIFGFVSSFASIYNLSTVEIDHALLPRLLEHFTLFLSTLFIIYPLWPKAFKKPAIMSAIWYSSILYILIIFSSTQAISASFNSFSAILFAVNLLVVSMLVRWQLALPLALFGISIACSIAYYNAPQALYYSGVMGNIQLQILYALVVVTSILIGFIKPRQDRDDLLQSLADSLEQKAAAMSEEARKALEVKVEFVNNMNHEVRTPVQGVSSMTASLVDNWENLSEKERFQSICMIDNNANRFFTLIDSILNFSNLASNKTKMDYSSVILRDLIIEALNHCRRYHLKNKPIQFEIVLEHPLMRMWCDRNYMYLVLVNLITNAIRYSEQGVVKIAAKNAFKRDEVTGVDSEHPAVELSVSDEGVGIPKGEEYSIFLPFTMSSSTYDKSGGRGIGLALSHLIIKQHEGSIWVEQNKAAGKGSIFIVRV